MKDPAIFPPDEAPPAPRHPFVTLAFITLFLLAFSAGLKTLRWQVESLTALRPHSRIKNAPVAPAAKGSAPRPGFRFALGQLTAPRVASVSTAGASSGAAVGSYELTSEQLFETYRAFYAQKGIRDEDYITLLAVNHSDRSWNSALAKAERAMDGGDFELARQTLEEALASTDPRNLIGRARLFEFMRQLEVRAGNPDLARELGHKFDEARIHAAEIVVRACGDQKGGITGEDGQQLLAALKFDEDMRDVVNQGGKAVSDQGEDPDKAPQRIAGSLLKAVAVQSDIGKGD